jgi:meiosis-specific transcription factor NDT80
METIVTLGNLYHVPQSAGQPEQPIGMSIHAQSYKNLFTCDGDWITYRRNYLSVTVSYSLANHTPGTRMRFRPNQKLKQGEEPISYEVYGFALGVAGIITDTGERMEMVQHTAKRDKGPQLIPQKQPMAPKGSEQRDVGSYGDGRGAFSDGYLTGGQALPTEHLFQRLQYRSATQNNGRRRAAQQYYNMLIELFADVGGQGPQQYVRVAKRKMFPVIVRGRSPGHYVHGAKKAKKAAKRRGDGKHQQVPTDDDESDQDEHPGGLSRHQGGGGGPGGASGSLGGGYNGMTGGGMGAYGQGGMLRGHTTGYPPQYDIRGTHMYGHGGGSGRMGHEASHRDAMDHHSKVFLPPYQGPVYEDQNGRLDMFNSQPGEQAATMQPSSLDMYNKAARLESGVDILPRPSLYMMRDNSHNSGTSFDGRCASNSVYPSQGLMPGNIMLS